MDYYFLNRREFEKEQISGDAFQSLHEFIAVNYTQEAQDIFQTVQNLRELEERNKKNEALKLEKKPKQRKTPRRDLILGLINKGLSNKDIAKRTGLRLNTIEHYKSKYMPKSLDECKKKIKITCRFCGNVKELPYYRKHIKFCSRKCYFDSLKFDSLEVNTKAVKNCRNK